MGEEAGQVTALRECRTCEWLFLRYVRTDRRMQRLCVCPTVRVNVRAAREVALGDSCDGWSVRRDPFEHEEEEA